MKIKTSELLSYIYITLYVLTIFSGSTFLNEAVMFLASIAAIILMISCSFKEIPKISKKNKTSKIIPFILLVFCFFLFFQLFYSFRSDTTLVYLERFICFLLLTIYVPKIELCIKAINFSKKYSFYVATSIILMTIITGVKTGGLVGSYQYAGMMMSIAFGLFLIDFLVNKKKSNLIGIIFILIALFISGKRMFTLIAFISYFVIYRLNEKKINAKFIIMTLCMIVAIGCMYLTVPQVHLIFDRLISTSSDSTLMGRSYFWDAAIRIFNNHKLFGIGMGCFRFYFDIYFHRYGNMEALDAHNIYLQMAAELGVVGELIMLFLFAISIWKTYKLLLNKNVYANIKYRHILLYSIFIQLWFIIYGLTGNPLYGANQMFMYITSVAMMLSVENEFKGKGDFL